MTKAKILVVEDEFITAEDIMSTLQRMNYDAVGSVADGESAVKMAQSLKPDLVLMDVSLKGKMDGVSTAEILGSKFGIPVIYLTAYADGPLLDRAKKTTPYGYVMKPYSDQDIRSNIEMALFKSRSDKQISHLNSVLRAIRNINQLITHEKDMHKLIGSACSLLVEERSYASAWIILLDENQNFIDSVETGVGKSFKKIIERYQNNDLPSCGKKVFKTSNVEIVENATVDCPDCPMIREYQDRKYIHIRFSHDERVYGLMSIGLDKVQVISDEELVLIREVADDLAFALYSSESRAEKQKLEVQLLQSQKLEAMGALVSSVAHEINNPLMGMINYADLIESRIADPQVKEYASYIMKEGNRIATIVKSLLAFSRTAQNIVSHVALRDVIESTLILMKPNLKKEQVELEIDLPDMLPEVKCNSQQIQQVLMNLITNAQHALGKRYKKFHENKCLIIRLTKVSEGGVDWQQIMVEDHGPGIPEKVAKKIFEPFYTTKPEGEGTGLGLSVSSSILKEHGGRIRVKSVENEYTRFFVELKE